MPPEGKALMLQRAYAQRLREPTLQLEGEPGALVARGAARSKNSRSTRRSAGGSRSTRSAPMTCRATSRGSRRCSPL